MPREFGPEHKLIGKNYATADLHAKVTGAAKYAEDYRAEGMLFCKLLLSPLPHARVTRIDASRALAMPGVRAIVTADDVPAPADSITDNGTVIKANKWTERGLTMEPLYQGEPILAVAAVDELTAAEAIEKIHIDFQRLPFVIDPLDTLRPRGPNARTDGNVWVTSQPPPQLVELKWTDADFAEAGEGRLPMGKALDEWSYGDLDAGFRQAALVLDETFVTPDTSHQTLETRSAMAYWQNGKVYVHTGTQSTAQTVVALARWLNLDPDKVAFISEYTGRRVRQQNHRRHLDDHPGAAVEEGERAGHDAHYARGGAFHRPCAPQLCRPDESRLLQGWPDHGARHVRDLQQRSVRRPGRRPDVGPHRLSPLPATSHALARRHGADQHAAAERAELARRSPGDHHHRTDHRESRARALGLDQVAIRRVNCPEGKAEFGPVVQGKRQHATSAFIKEALDRGAEQFKWRERATRHPKRIGSKVRGVGVSLSCYVGGTIGFDGLLVIKPDGRIQVHSGIGNLGTESVIDVHRVVAEVLGVPWEKCDIAWGSSLKNLPWTCPSGGSQTTHAMTRAAHAVAMDARKKLQDIAAKSLGGRPDEYEVANERVFRKGGGAGMTLAQAAQRAIQLGGIYDGHEAPANVNRMTKASVAALAGQGLVAAARDTYPHDGATYSYVASFAEVQVDVETGKADHRFPRIRRCRHGDPSAGARRSGARPVDARHWPRDWPEMGVRSPLRHHGVQAVLPEQAAHDPGCPRRHAMGRARHSGSRDAGRRSRHRRAARGWWVLRHPECALRRAW